MSRYYHNENPQVRHWMGKCAMLQQELDTANETIIQKKRIGLHFIEKCQLMKERMSDFNSLPWYKKMFYKFNI
jgi:hypothetical protein